MDYVEVLANWCVRRGVAVPTYEEVGALTYVKFLGKHYSASPLGRLGMQCAAQEAYEHSGMFGKVIQTGFVPFPRRDREFLVDLAHGRPGCLLGALNEAPMNVQVTAFAPYGDTTSYPQDNVDTPYSYTIYSTVHPGDEAFWARVDWYIQMRIPTWLNNGTTIYVYSDMLGGDYLRGALEGVGIPVVLM